MAKSQKLKTLEEHFQETEEILSKRGERPELPITTIPSFDRKIWGLKRRELMLIAARTSIGKTSLALQLAWDMAVNKKKVIFFSLEMHVPALIERLFCNVEGIDNEDLLHGKFKEKYQNEWAFFKNLLNSHYLVFNDSIGKTWEEINQLLGDLKDKPDVVFVDHVNHVRASQSQDDKKTIDDYIRKFREMAIRDNFAGVLCAQINRFAQSDNKDKEPELHHLKGSGRLEEESDAVLLLTWPWKYNEKEPENKFKFILAKNRNGRTGYVDVDYNAKYYKFSDWQEEAMKLPKEYKSNYK